MRPMSKRILRVGLLQLSSATALLLSLSFTQPAQAMAIDWSGRYRFEVYDIENTSLAKNGKSTKAYWAHNFDLRPEVIVNDSLRMKALVTLTPTGTPGFQLGQTMGSRNAAGSLGGYASETASYDNMVLQESNKEAGIGVRFAYAEWLHEFGMVTVGRRPLDFGLGLLFSSGSRDFDHWYDSIDGFGYQMSMGAFEAEVILGYQYEGDISRTDDVRDMIARVGYVSESSAIELGALIRQRNAGPSILPPFETTPISTLPPGFAGDGDPATVQTGRYNVQDVHFFVSSLPSDKLLQYGFEFGFQSGNLGITNQDASTVKMEGYGFAGEVSYGKDKKDVNYSLLFGFASGDNPDTTDVYEGFVFDRNYDIAFLMLNHPLGQVAGLSGGAGYRLNPSGSAESLFDEERVGNVVYFSPRLNWQLSNKYGFQFAFTTAQLNAAPLSEMENALGTELDIHFNYKPYDQMTWRTSIGYVIPGGAFKGSATAPNQIQGTYGIMTQAAINF